MRQAVTRKELNKECVMVLENLIREIHNCAIFNAHDGLDYIAAIRYAIAIIETRGDKE